MNVRFFIVIPQVSKAQLIFFQFIFLLFRLNNFCGSIFYFTKCFPLLLWCHPLSFLFVVIFLSSSSSFWLYIYCCFFAETFWFVAEAFKLFIPFNHVWKCSLKHFHHDPKTLKSLSDTCNISVIQILASFDYLLYFCLRFSWFLVLRSESWVLVKCSVLTGFLWHHFNRTRQSAFR